MTCMRKMTVFRMLRVLFWPSKEVEKSSQARRSSCLDDPSFLSKATVGIPRKPCRRVLGRLEKKNIADTKNQSDPSRRQICQAARLGEDAGKGRPSFSSRRGPWKRNSSPRHERSRGRCIRMEESPSRGARLERRKSHVKERRG